MSRQLRIMIVRFMENERQKSFRENELYKLEILEEFFDYLDEVKNFEWEIKDIITDDGSEYREGLETEGKKPASVEWRILVIKSFLEFAREAGVVSENPWEDIT